MKRLFLILVIVGMETAFLQAQDQGQAGNNTLMQTLVGKWKVVSYESDRETSVKPKMLEFKSDGTFESDSAYFTTKEGLFRTDKDSGLVILENGNQQTEWKATLKRGILKMELIPKLSQTKISMTLVRVIEG